MTRNGIFKNSKSKLILILLLVAVLCFSMFAVACNNNDDDDEATRPTYTHTEKDDGLISNPNFVYGTSSLELKDFPKTSPTGWSRSKDSNNNIASSSADSGVVNVSEDGWTELLNALYEDDEILNYVLNENGIDKDDVIESIKTEKEDEDYKPNDDEIQAYIIEKYFLDYDKDENDDISEEEKGLFTNPSTHEDNTSDKMIYMLNNYRAKASLGLGVSQKITSSSTITLDKGTYGKFSVYIKTANILAAGDDYGANIRIISTFNGTTQAEYALTNIIAEDWTEYVIYVKADEQFDCTFKIALGLGYGLDGITQGTAYFDNVSFEKDVTLDVDVSYVSYFNYNSEDKIIINNKNRSDTPLVYDMSLNSNGYLNKPTNQSSTLVTTSFDGSEKTTTLTPVEVCADDSPYGKNVEVESVKVEVKNGSAKLTFGNFDAVGCKEYAYVSFYVKNQLDKFGSSDITVNVYDMLDGKNDIVTRGIATVSTISDEWQHVNILIKNNFVDDKKDETQNDTDRNYKIELIIGPTDPKAAEYKDEFASGTVTITTPLVATGTIYANATKAENNNEKELYDLFSLYTSSLSGTVALYAGSTADFTEDSDNTTYSFSVAPSDIGTILTNPANVNGYQGIVANHIYVKEDGTETSINTRAKDGDDGSFAGLINTKYIDSDFIKKTGLSNLSKALSFTETDDEESIQPLMIYNKERDNYGFIGNSNTISASSYAKVSVTLRVVDDAVANIYLVNSSNKEKSVLTFADFTLADGTKVNGSEMKLNIKVTSDMMAQNGWVTVDFYVATGVDSKTFRLELWNGYRDAAENEGSQGYVFFKSATITTSSGFSEASRLEDTFSVSGNPLYTEKILQGETLSETYLYTRELTELEREFNAEQKNSADKVSYKENYVWAQSETMIYAVYNTIEFVETDPYANQETDDETDSGCAAETDPSTFWLSFSSILLGVALIIAIIMLFIKNIRRRRKANASDAKSHYTITSRTKNKKNGKEAPETAEEVDVEEENAEEEPESDNDVDVEPEETNEVEEDQKENESYVYGDVQVFGEEGKNDGDNK